MRKILMYSLTVLAGALPMRETQACTRILYQGAGDVVVTARTMDWAGDLRTNLWVFPRGMERTGETGPNSFRWTSKYGSVIASAFDFSTCDGMNEAGLCGNYLWLNATEYPQPDGRPGMSLAIWLQYILDRFGTVAEAVETLAREEFVVMTAPLPGQDKPAKQHVALSDATGDNAILEYIDGRLKIYHDRNYRVLANDPAFDQQLAIARSWKDKDKSESLPGSHKSSDRFVRAGYLVNRLPEMGDAAVAVPAVFTVLRAISIPFGPEKQSTTIWRTLFDQKNRVYYFENPYNLSLFRVEFADVDFSPGAPVKVLRLTGGESYAGNVAGQFVSEQPFRFFGL